MVKKQISVILAIILAVTSGGVSDVLGKTASDTAVDKGAQQGCYAEGSAIVCLKAAEDECLGSDRGDDILSLAETLMEIDESPEAEAVTGGFDPGTESPDDGYVLKLVKSDTLSTEELVEKLSAREDVVFAEPDYILNVEDTTGAAGSVGKMIELQAEGSGVTPDFTYRQYVAKDPDKGDGYGMNIPGWNDPGKKNSEGVVVAIVDTGVDYNNEDLKNVMWDKGEEYPTLKAMGGGKYGFNALDLSRPDFAGYSSSDPMDDNGHGTHCAGIIAGEWNGYGISGVANGAKIMALKVMGEPMFSSQASCSLRAYAYIREAKKAGVNVQVTSNSWGVYYPGESIPLAVRELSRLGILTVFAASNDSYEIDTKVANPSVLAGEEATVIVDASDREGIPASFSNFGSKNTDVFAPGVAIMSTAIKDQGMAFPEKETAVAFDGFDGKKSALYQKFLSGVDGKWVEDGIRFVDGVRDGDTGENSGCLLIDPDEKERVTRFETVSYNGPDLTEIRPEYIALRYKAIDPEADKNWEWMWISVTDSDEPVWVDEWNGFREDGWITVYFRLPENTDYSNPEFKMIIQTFDRNLKDIASEVLVDDITFTNTAYPYCSKQGTSMAVPAVAGEAAILAAAFPDDTVRKRRARIIGSVYKTDSLGECRAGGLASVKKALDQDTSPVPFDVSLTDDLKFTITGDFFGDKEGKVRIDGKDAKVLTWSDMEITLELTEKIGGSFVEVNVIAADGNHSGRGYFTVPDKDKTYDPLPLPDKTEAPDFYNSTGYELRGLDDSLYYVMGTQTAEMESDLYPRIWRYDIKGKSWENVFSSDDYLLSGKGLVLSDKKLIFQATRNGKAGILSFDSDKKEALFKEIALPEPITNMSMTDLGDKLVFIGGMKKVDEDWLPQKSIYVSDISGENIALAGELGEARAEPTLVKSGGGDGEDTVIYALMGKVYDKSLYVSVVNGTDSTWVRSLERIRIREDGSAEAQTVSGDIAPAGFDENQQYALAAGYRDQALILSGPTHRDEKRNKISDTYTFDPVNERVLKDTGRMISYENTAFMSAAVYDGTYYCIGQCTGKEKFFFVSDPGAGSKADDAAGDTDEPKDLYVIESYDGYQVRYLGGRTYNGKKLSAAELDITVEKDGAVLVPKAVGIKKGKDAGQYEITLKRLKVKDKNLSNRKFLEKAAKASFEKKTFTVSIYKAKLTPENVLVLTKRDGTIKGLKYLPATGKKSCRISPDEYTVETASGGAETGSHHIIFKSSSLNYEGDFIVGKGDGS